MLSKYKFSGTGNNGVFGWLLQRISSIVLLFAVTFHIFGMITGSYDGMQRPVLGMILIFGVFHAVNGLKMITDDYVSCLGKRLLLLIIYWLIGIVMIIQGIGLLP